MKYIKCIKDTALLTAGTWYGISELNFYGAIVTVFRPLDNDWVMSDKENFDMGFLLDHNPDLKNETLPINKEYKMKEFQNKQHKRLHNALIGAGFTDCGGENLPNETLYWNHGYINQDLDEYLYFDYCDDGMVHIRNISNNKARFYGNSVDNIITHYESLGQTQPITKDNIAEVLKFNNITDISVHSNSLGKKHCFSLSMKPDNWLDTLEAIVGKLKPMPKLEEIVLKVGDIAEVDNYGNELVIVKIDYVNEEVVFRFGGSTLGQSFNFIHTIKSVNGKSGIYKIPEFNFEQYLLDNGFTFKHGIGDDIIYYHKDISQGFIRNGYFVYNSSSILLTPENADKIIELAKLSESLERKI